MRGYRSSSYLTDRGTFHVNMGFWATRLLCLGTKLWRTERHGLEEDLVLGGDLAHLPELRAGDGCRAHEAAHARAVKHERHRHVTWTRAQKEHWTDCKDNINNDVCIMCFKNHSDCVQLRTETERALAWPGCATEK